jgi:hypothetical protein
LVHGLSIWRLPLDESQQYANRGTSAKCGEPASRFFHFTSLRSSSATQSESGDHAPLSRRHVHLSAKPFSQLSLVHAGQTVRGLPFLLLPPQAQISTTALLKRLPTCLYRSKTIHTNTNTHTHRHTAALRKHPCWHDHSLSKAAKRSAKRKRDATAQKETQVKEKSHSRLFELPPGQWIRCKQVISQYRKGNPDTALETSSRSHKRANNFNRNSVPMAAQLIRPAQVR